MPLFQKHYRGTVPDTVYMGIDEECGLYVGITGHPERRAQAHARNGRNTVESHHSDDAFVEEVRTIHFYDAQIEDGEDFTLCNRADRISDWERERRWPENHPASDRRIRQW